MSEYPMNKENLNVSHLAWCGLIALHTARQDGVVSSPAQDNLFLTRWLATAEKQRRFGRELANDISWLLREGRGKGLRADLPGKLDYLWRAGNGNLQAQNDLFRLQHALHAAKLTGWIYMVLAESEWSGRSVHQYRASTSTVMRWRPALMNRVSSAFPCRSGLLVPSQGSISYCSDRAGAVKQPALRTSSCIPSWPKGSLQSKSLSALVSGDGSLFLRVRTCSG